MASASCSKFGHFDYDFQVEVEAGLSLSLLKVDDATGCCRATF